MKKFIKVIDQMGVVHLINTEHISEIKSAAVGVDIYIAEPNQSSRKITVCNLSLEQVKQLIEGAQ